MDKYLLCNADESEPGTFKDRELMQKNPHVLIGVIACRLLDRRSGQCSNYRHRRAFVAECVRLTPGNVRGIDWLPSTCAYRLRAAGELLPDWHHLNSGDREAVHRAGVSVRGWTISEDDAGDLENHIIDRVL